MAEKKNTAERMYVILTEFKEIFAGYAGEVSGDRIKMRNARQACYYSPETHGLLGLAVTGPAKGSKIGPAANIEARRVVNVIECTPEATDAWLNARWE